MMEEYVIGIDIGGTLARAVVLESTTFEIKDQLTKASSDDGQELVQIIKSLLVMVAIGLNKLHPKLNFALKIM